MTLKSNLVTTDYAACAEQVEGLGGEVSFTSNTQGGSRIDVKLPIL